VQVRAKKSLGQHFLNDESVARSIADTLTLKGYDNVLEIGPGMGVLTKYLLEKPITTYVIEIDEESASYLQAHYLQLSDRIIQEDVLKYDFSKVFADKSFAIIGNFPYNISSQILFKCLAHRTEITGIVGMFQKEVAQRICEKPGSRQYGILSVLMQAFYEVEYGFTIKPGAFNPPPKVDSAVIHCKRKAKFHLDCDEDLFFRVVKMAFNQRRKILRNSLKSLMEEKDLPEALAMSRPEQLDVEAFVLLTTIIERANE